MKKLDEQLINDMYIVLVEGVPLNEARPDLYTAEDDDLLDIISPSYINDVVIENGEKVIYWEQDYIAHYYRMGEYDGEREQAIINALDDYGLWSV